MPKATLLLSWLVARPNTPCPERCNPSNLNRSNCLRQVLDRFPLLDYTDTTLPPQVAMFAHPEGLTCKRQAPLPIFFTIVFTSNEGRRVYASVLTFHDVLQQVGHVTT
jgi:hypothetical protein